MRDALRIAAEAVLIVRFLVQAFEQTTVQERDAAEEVDDRIWRNCELFRVTVEQLDTEMLPVLRERAFAGEVAFLNLAVQGREEEVLEDGAVVVVLLRGDRVEGLEEFFQIIRVKDFIWDQVFLANEPY
ncbi:MAG: hypothetical protein PHG96_07125 [Kiritimatiellae bacterium]|nr:hypothetical protein [Kiritimatiellia bacterium]